MSSALLRQAGNELAWSLWTELGVAGVVRNHSRMVIDVEPLLAVTPMLAEDEPRLVEQVLYWCVCHGDRVNAGRLATLVAALPAAARAKFEGFGSTVNSTAGTKWPAAGPVGPPPPRLRDVPLPLERPALLRLRARAVCGVGTRADVLCDLVMRSREWSTATQLSEAGHSKRNVARVLAELDEAGFLSGQVAGNILQFRLAQREAFMTALGGAPPSSPAWVPVFAFVVKILRLTVLADESAVVRRVEANTLRDELLPIGTRLWLGSPPATRGSPDAWEVMNAWGADQLAQLAAGTSAALGEGGAPGGVGAR